MAFRARAHFVGCLLLTDRVLLPMCGKGCGKAEMLKPVVNVALGTPVTAPVVAYNDALEPFDEPEPRCAKPVPPC